MNALRRRCNRIFPALSEAANILPPVLVLAAVLSIAQPAIAQTFSLLYQFKSGRDGDNPYASLILDPQGNLYGTTMIDGAYSYGTVFKVSPAGEETVLHSFTGTGGDGANPVASLIRDAAGNLYGTTEYGGVFGAACGANGCGIVFKLSKSGKETVLYRFTGGDGMNPWQGLVRDSAGNLYGTTLQGGDFGGGTVFKLDSASKETVLHSFNTNSRSGDGSFPFGGSLLRDSAGNLYGTTEAGGSQLGGTVFRLDQSGTETILHNFAFNNGDGAIPYGSLLRNAAGNLYGATMQGGSHGLGVVFKLDGNNTETVIHSFGGTGDGVPPGTNLAMDLTGNLYGTTHYGGRSYFGTVFKLDASGKETILHSFSGKDGNGPGWGVIRDSMGNLYGTAQFGGAYGGGVVFKIAP
jgi:uncharacterized repeat protein (TIGR03803 family)